MSDRGSGTRRKPVMVFAGDFWAGSSGAGLADGFRNLGWLVQEVDTSQHIPRVDGRFLLKVASRLTRKAAMSDYQQKLLDECKMLRPDVFLTIKGIGVTQHLLKEIRAAGVGTVMYYPDFHFRHGGVFVDSFDKYDLFVTTKSFQVPWLMARLPSSQVACVPHAHSFLTHTLPYEKISESDYQWDVLYAGNHSAYKQKWLESIAPLAGKLRIGIVGNRWSSNSVRRALSEIEILGARNNVGFADAIQRSRINVAFHAGPDAAGWQDLVSTRTFEIPACGGFMLHIDNDEVREFFEPGKEIDVFSSPEELKEKIAFYLNRPELREKMKERAYARCRTEHSYRNRAKDIARILIERGILNEGMKQLEAGA